MVRVVKNESDLIGIKIGEEWYFDGWPDPPIDDDADRFDKLFESASNKYIKLSDFANKEVLKSIAKDNKK